MMSVIIETVATQTLLGIRFWDPAANRAVTSGLRVTAQLLSAGGTRRVGPLVGGRPTQAGVYAFFGLHPDEAVGPSPDVQIWETIPPLRQAVIEVVDARGRYLPASFSVDVPHRGPVTGRGDWIPDDQRAPVLPGPAGPGVFLWPQAGRDDPPNGRTMIHGRLVVGNGDAPPPAAHALVCLAAADGAFYGAGLTDATGRLALPAPYPSMPEPADNGTWPPLATQLFPVTVHVFYAPAEQVRLPGCAEPDYRSIFRQAPARIGVERRLDPPALQTSETLVANLSFGAPFVLRTAVPGRARGEGVLRVVPA